MLKGAKANIKIKADGISKSNPTIKDVMAILIILSFKPFLMPKTTKGIGINIINRGR